MNKSSIYIPLFLSFIFCLNNKVIDGYIYNSNGKPIYNAEVYIESNSLGSASDSSGYFKITSPLLLSKENSFLRVSHIGYISKMINIYDVNNIEVYLEKDLLSAEQIVVTALGYKSYIKDTPVITHVITNEEIYNSPNSSVRDIIEFVMPNVQRIHDPHGNDRVKIQGLDNKFVVFMVDGNRISGEFAGNIDLSMLSVSNIDRIEIIRSGMSTLYGSDSMGGLINIITKKNKSPISLDLSYTYDLPVEQLISLNFTSNISNFRYKLNLEYNDSPGYDLTDYSPFSKTLEENLHYKINNSLSYSGKYFSFNYVNQYYVKKIKRYSNILNNQTGTREFALSGKNPYYNDIMNSFNLNYKLNDYSAIQLQYLNEVYNKNIYFPYYNNEYPNSIDSGEVILSGAPSRNEFLLSFKTLIKKHSLLSGFEYAKETYQSFNIYSREGNLLEPAIFNNELKKNLNEYSLFFIDKFKIFQEEVVLGVRSTKYKNKPWNIIPSLSVRHELYGYNLRLNYSKGYRVPSIKELYYKYEGHSPALYGDPNLEPSLSNYYAISLESRGNNSSSLEFYFNSVKNMISTIYKSDGIYYSNSDKVNLFGFNLNLQKKLFNCIDVNSVYSYTDAISDNLQLEEGISAHTLSLRMKYNIFNNLNILWITKYNSEKNIFLYDIQKNKELDAFSISSIMLSAKYKKISFKFGCKNIFNYLDPHRVNSESNDLLTTTSPRRRLYSSIIVSI